jgi:hypothetical protein
VLCSPSCIYQPAKRNPVPTFKSLSLKKEGPTVTHYLHEPNKGENWGIEQGEEKKPFIQSSLKRRYCDPW